jgi:hypothetical protein
MMQQEKPDENDDYDFEKTEEDIKELDERRRKRLSGESTLYTWEEVKAMLIRKAKPDNSN